MAIETVPEWMAGLEEETACPVCGGRLEKRKDFEMRPGTELNSKADPIFVPDAEIRKYRYFFCCRKCSREFPLKELAERKR